MRILGPIALVVALHHKEHSHVAYYHMSDGALAEQPYDFFIDLGQQRLPNITGEFEVKIIPYHSLVLVRPR